jgi:histidine ammonia-lyase
MKAFNYGIDHLTPGVALELMRGSRSGTFSRKAIEKINACHEAVSRIVENQTVVYGVNTGFGPLCTTIISSEKINELQANILKSHSVGVGNPVNPEIARLMMILKLHALSMGYSGVALPTLERISLLIEKEIIPVVPEQGSVGASGDLAPLAHLFLPLIGLGKVWYKGRIQETAGVLRKESLKPLELGAKEGLALINGTQFITAHAVMVLEKLRNCLEAADIISAMSLEALLGSVKPFHPQIHKIRPFPGSILVARRMRGLLAGSEMVQSHVHCGSVQDPYSLRCIPQVHGASRDAWLHLKDVVDCELNSVTDNPVILDAENTISCGNFHGQPLALPLDYTALAAAEIGNISDRRTYLLLEGRRGLPSLLMRNTGVNSGFMLAQYTSAALVSENKTLCFPASADSIPTSLGQEDHVSMGPISARKTLSIISNLEKILAVELTCAAQAFDYRRPLKSSPILEACHNLVREKIDHTEEDRVFSEDIQRALLTIQSNDLVQLADKTAVNEKINLNGEDNERFGIY